MKNVIEKGVLFTMLKLQSFTRLHEYALGIFRKGPANKKIFVLEQISKTKKENLHLEKTLIQLTLRRCNSLRRNLFKIHQAFQQVFSYSKNM